MVRSVHLILFLCYLCTFLFNWHDNVFVLGKTKADERRKRSKGDFKVIKGAYFGDVELLRDGLSNGGNPNAVLSKEIGEKYLKFGRAHIDFPVAPAIHIAINGGTYTHLRAAHALIIAGANLNYHYIDRVRGAPVFFPALYYGLGAFSAPNEGHAGMLQTLLVSYPKKFNFTVISEWVRSTGSPPPLHTAVVQNFFDGVYLLATTKGYNINERDLQGLTALHVAAWLGNSEFVALLVHNGADPFSVDSHGRTFMHYVAVRGIGGIAVRMIAKSSAIPDEIKLRLLEVKDLDNRTALDLSFLPPAQMRVASVIKLFIENATRTSILTPQLPTETVPKSCISDSELAQWNGWVDFCPFPVGEFQHQTKVWGQVKTFDISRETLSVEEFMINFFTPQRPLVITGNLTSRMPFWKYAYNRGSFLRSYGNMEVNVTSGCETEEKAEVKCFGEVVDTTTVRKYLERQAEVEECLSSNPSAHTSSGIGNNDLDLRGSSSGKYGVECCDQLSYQESIAVSVVAEDVLHDFSISSSVDLFNICFAAPLVGTVQLRLSSGKVVGTPLQSNSAMWNVLLAGRERRWYMLSPGAALNATYDKKLHGDISPYEWATTVFPRLRKRRLAVEVVQRVGDVMFVPHGWSHFTLSSGEVIDLSTQFCTLPGNISVFEQVPTGIRMYGM
mmetsp:Transcript_22376/g.32609  ORF Transcript_22376/g.32609 Transcript_22376/m.32609 type:complete len:671 (+) Transcript_22376:76-2088(+)